MNYLIVGARGLLGYELVKLIVSKPGHFVYSVSKQTLDIDHTNHQGIISDINDFDFDCLDDLHIDAIYYVAQSNNFRNFPEDSLDVLNINMKAPLQFINWASQNNVKSFIYTSSGGIYEEQVRLHEDANINVENDLGFYLNSKLCAEIMLSNYKDLIENLVILRPFFMYGERQKSGMLIPRLISLVATESNITIDSEEGISLNPIHVKDASIAAFKASMLSGYHKINLAGSQNVSLKKLLEIIAKHKDKKLHLTSNKIKPRNLVGDIAKMKKILHKPEIDLEEGLNRMIKHHNS